MGINQISGELSCVSIFSVPTDTKKEQILQDSILKKPFFSSSETFAHVTYRLISSNGFYHIPSEWQAFPLYSINQYKTFPLFF